MKVERILKQLVALFKADAPFLVRRFCFSISLLFCLAGLVRLKPPFSSNRNDRPPRRRPLEHQLSLAGRQPSSSPGDARTGAQSKLSATDLEIKADGKPATVNEVHRVARGALNYCLLLDSRSSQQEHFKLQQYEATQLLSQVVQAGKDSGILVAFDDHFHLDAEGTSPQEFVNAIARVKPHSRIGLR